MRVHCTLCAGRPKTRRGRPPRDRRLYALVGLVLGAFCWCKRQSDATPATHWSSALLLRTFCGCSCSNHRDGREAENDALVTLSLSLQLSLSALKLGHVCCRTCAEAHSCDSCTALDCYWCPSSGECLDDLSNGNHDCHDSDDASCWSCSLSHFNITANVSSCQWCDGSVRAAVSAGCICCCCI